RLQGPRTRRARAAKNTALLLFSQRRMRGEGAMAEDTEELAARITRINKATERVRGQARSTDGTVYIETDTRGAITDLWLSPYAFENGADRLAALIADRHRVAHQNAEAEAERIFTESTRESSYGNTRPHDPQPENSVLRPSEPTTRQPWSFAPPNRRHGEAGHGPAGGHEYVI
ncbi:YbaB/EbfC family nucleoid-associated protein, partial [Nocardia sp. 004]|uniref:YbaB/EbfC family nucleoid-associated protein n=1 Tax=Nocardia sp. 004 TaxID=3385978 RepID=UPI0039A34449